MEITKNKLPKGSTYPLKSSLLKVALEASDINLPVTLCYEDSADLFVAHYFFPRTWEDFEKINIFSGSVSSRDSEEAIEHLESRVIPEFITWLSEYVNAPENSSKYTGHNSVKWSSPQFYSSANK